MPTPPQVLAAVTAAGLAAASGPTRVTATAQAGGLPDALVIALTLAVVALVGVPAAMLWRRRGVRRTAAAAATHLTLVTASRAARHLRDGLTPPAAVRAAHDVRVLLGVAAVALGDAGGPLAWEGRGDHHADSLARHADPVLTTGATVRLDERDLTCDDPDCPVRGAILAPVVSDGRVVAVLGAYDLHVSTDLVRATEAVADWVSAQVELADLSQERSRTAEAELRALRAQINPHFVHNSLAAIASFVRTDPDRARELLLDFADFMRYSFRATGPIATLSEELGNIQRYLELEKARFGERLQVSLLVAPEVLGIGLPTLAVQPLVENAVQHGIEAKAGPGHISISATDLGHESEIVIEDDGLGADPEVVRAVLAGHPGGDHVGLANVDARLRHTYGDEYGLVVETAPGAGTRVSFRVPKYSARAT